MRPSVWRLHRAGEELIREDTADEQFHIVASGLLKVTRRGKRLNAVSPGERVGEMAYARPAVDKLSDSCRARFNEAFLAIMAERLTMLTDD